jgi:murein DD-endopeptidase MepM/ murein hydrolase activator NlpD
MHEGTDLYRAPGDPIPAFFDGIVADIDPARYGGVFTGITIRNDNGTTSYFLYARSSVAVGQRVRPGDIIAYSQDLTAYADYANVPNHVHVELWTGADRSLGNVVNFEGLF